MMDDIKYSRQRYALGDGAMIKLTHSSVYLRGFGALGVEISKNLILAGIGKLTIHDCKIATSLDLNFNFFLDKNAVNKTTRVQGSLTKMMELNPSVEIEVIVDNTEDLTFLTKFQCVILTETLISEMVSINNFCRQQNPATKFIATDCLGILCSCFCDFGDRHEVVDADGEEPKMFLVNRMDKKEKIITVLLTDNEKHNFEIGDSVSFHDVKTIDCINKCNNTVVLTSSHSFEISHDHPNCTFKYYCGGKCQKIKAPTTVHCELLEKQVSNPKFVDVGINIEDSFTCHLAMLTLLHKGQSFTERMEFINKTKDICKIYELQGNEINFDLLSAIGYASTGVLPPLVAFMGGVVAQEVIKALTNKFTPIDQWFYFHAADFAKGMSTFKSDFFDTSGICVTDQLYNTLKSLKVLLVGCGAIGCEMLKNLTLLNVGTFKEITITDSDFVEESNLTRQFLFRKSSIQKPKSVAAAEFMHLHRPDIKIQPYNLKVCSDTQSFFTDEFFTSQDVIIAALDNIEGRQYLDRRCVDNCRPLLESGTFGSKGHVQVILPHVTESYTSQADPIDNEIPYCTLKSFPTAIEHTIQWARDKFDSIFLNKPNMARKFVNTRSVWEANLKKADTDVKMDQEYQNMIPNVANFLRSALKEKPIDWSHCLTFARLKFEKYFNHKGKQLLFKFPADMKLDNGDPFWHYPRQPPNPLTFNLRDPLHFTFILSTAKLLASVWGLSFSASDLSYEVVEKALSAVRIPDFIPDSLKEVETDEKSMPSIVKKETDAVDFKSALDYMRIILKQDIKIINPQEFQKDDEENGHIHFVASASNLRAMMYGIEPVSVDRTRRIAGNIIPAIITTTSAIAGLLTLELLRLTNRCSREQHQNCFLNLALTKFIFAEPAPAPVYKLKNGVQYTLWDKWEVQGSVEFTLSDFIKEIRAKYGLAVDSVIQGTKILYLSFIPTYSSKLSEPMLSIIDLPKEGFAVELVVDSDDGSESISPPIKYFIKKS